MAAAGQVSPVERVVLAPIGDVTLLEAHPNTNQGFDDPRGLALGQVDGGRARALIQFSLADIPADGLPRRR